MRDEIVVIRWDATMEHHGYLLWSMMPAVFVAPCLSCVVQDEPVHATGECAGKDSLAPHRNPSVAVADDVLLLHRLFGVRLADYMAHAHAQWRATHLPTGAPPPPPTLPSFLDADRLPAGTRWADVEDESPPPPPLSSASFPPDHHERSPYHDAPPHWHMKRSRTWYRHHQQHK